MGKKRTVLVEDAPDGGFFEVGFKAGDVGVVVDILSNGAGDYPLRRTRSGHRLHQPSCTRKSAAHNSPNILPPHKKKRRRPFPIPHAFVD